ncbi:MAG: hypothetical protein ACKOZL_03345 [Actinomycetes bacterium]
MPQRPDLTRLIDAGADFVELTRSQARGRARVLVEQGVLAQSQVQSFVDGIVDESRRRRDAAVNLVRGEVARQVKSLGLVTRDDLDASERRLRRELGGATAKAKGAAKAPKGSKQQATKATSKQSAKQAPKKKATGSTKAAKRPSKSAKPAARKAAKQSAKRSS